MPLSQHLPTKAITLGRKHLALPVLLSHQRDVSCVVQKRHTKGRGSHLKASRSLLLRSQKEKQLPDSLPHSTAASLIYSERVWRMISIARALGDDKGERTIWLQDNRTLTQVFFTLYPLLLAHIWTAWGIQDQITWNSYFSLHQRVNSAEILLDKTSYCETHNVCIVPTHLLQG